MKLTKEELKQIIKEEVDTAIEEGWLDRMMARGHGALKGAGGRLKGAAQAGAGHLAGALGSEEGAAALAQSAAETRAAADERGRAARGLHIAQASYKEFANDLEKLGVADIPELARALEQLKFTMDELTAKVAEE